LLVLFCCAPNRGILLYSLLEAVIDDAFVVDGRPAVGSPGSGVDSGAGNGVLATGGVAAADADGGGGNVDVVTTATVAAVQSAAYYLDGAQEIAAV
jgi:hypothetical protein